MLRIVSLAIRKFQDKKNEQKVFNTFQSWCANIATLPNPPAPKQRKLIIIKLDDIGDYLVFRNGLATIRTAPRWQGYHITLLGNAAWKTIHNFADNTYTDATIWMNKGKFFEDHDYRMSLWTELKQAGFEVVICPSYTRPLLLDDVCALACQAPLNIAHYNTFKYPSWNEASDSGYQELYKSNSVTLEYNFNTLFTHWCCNLPVPDNIKSINIPIPEVNTSLEPPYIMCFIGASTKSRQWPTPHWIDLIQKLNKQYSLPIVLAGGPSDAALAANIINSAPCSSVVGTISLVEMITFTAKSSLVITNNTMMTHLAIACGCKTAIITNGENYYRFTEYNDVGYTRTRTIYPPKFAQLLAKPHGFEITHHVAVTSDIATVSVESVFKAADSLLQMP